MRTLSGKLLIFCLALFMFSCTQEEQEFDTNIQATVESRSDCGSYPVLDITDYGGDDAWEYVQDITSATMDYLWCEYPPVISNESECDSGGTVTMDFLDLCRNHNVVSCEGEDGETTWTYLNPVTFDPAAAVQSVISEFYAEQDGACEGACFSRVVGISLTTEEGSICECGLGSGCEDASIPCAAVPWMAMTNHPIKLNISYECCCLELPGPDDGPGGPIFDMY